MGWWWKAVLVLAALLAATVPCHSLTQPLQATEPASPANALPGGLSLYPPSQHTPPALPASHHHDHLPFLLAALAGGGTNVGVGSRPVAPLPPAQLRPGVNPLLPVAMLLMMMGADGRYKNDVFVPAVVFMMASLLPSGVL